MCLYKQAALIVIGIFFASPAFSQSTKKEVKIKVPPSGGTFISADQSKMLCKAWKLDSISAFGVQSKPKAKETQDGITPVADGSIFLTLEGIASTGRWTCAGQRLIIALDKPKDKISFKIISLTDNRMVLEYQYPAPDYSKVSYIYSSGK